MCPVVAGQQGELRRVLSPPGDQVHRHGYDVPLTEQVVLRGAVGGVTIPFNDAMDITNPFNDAVNVTIPFNDAVVLRGAVGGVQVDSILGVAQHWSRLHLGAGMEDQEWIVTRVLYFL